MEDIIKILIKYYPTYLEGLWGTLWISAVTVLFGTLLGMVIALGRMSKVKPLNWLTGIYIEVLRGTPVLIQLYFFWLVLDDLLALTETQSVVVALIINASAYIAEIIRAGINAVDKGQWEAAKSIGLSGRNTMTRVILPQAVKNILPALCNEFISTVKGSSLASVLLVNELTTSYKIASAATFKMLPSLVISGAVYFIVNFILSKLLKALERRLSVSD